MPNATLSEARKRQGELGQFLTPAPVANFMASLFGPLPDVVRLLDAGAGAGALTAAFVSRLCEKKDGVRAIEATLFELDPFIQDVLSKTMQDCQHVCAEAGIRFTFTIHATNFIHEMSALLAEDLFATTPPAFDAAITNPPYRKISIDSAERRALRSVGIETSNLYTGFIALIQKVLVPAGQVVGITPRSFCNGPYFRPFREDFLSNLELRRLHVFESRNAAFRDDSVLQENIKTKKRGRESFLIARSETCLNTLLRTDLILTPHHSRLTFHVLSISRRVAGIRFIGFLRSVSCVWFDERERPDRPAHQIDCL